MGPVLLLLLGCSILGTPPLLLVPAPCFLAMIENLLQELELMDASVILTHGI